MPTGTSVPILKRNLKTAQTVLKRLRQSRDAEAAGGFAAIMGNVVTY